MGKLVIVVILSPSLVILSETKDLVLSSGKLREESNHFKGIDHRDSSLPAGGRGLPPQNDITTQTIKGRGGWRWGRVRR